MAAGSIATSLSWASSRSTACSNSSRTGMCIAAHLTLNVVGANVPFNSSRMPCLTGPSILADGPCQARHRPLDARKRVESTIAHIDICSETLATWAFGLRPRSTGSWKVPEGVKRSRPARPSRTFSAKTCVRPAIFCKRHRPSWAAALSGRANATSARAASAGAVQSRYGGPSRRRRS